MLGAFDKALVRGILSPNEYSTVRRRFLLETKRFIRLGVLRLVPVRLKFLIDSWSLLEKYHLYQADALQIVSARAVNASQFLTADKRVYDVAVAEGMSSILLT